MTPRIYFFLTPWEVALALAISGDDELKGADIARDMLAGNVKFSRGELEKLAAFREVSVEYMTENDPSFRAYANPGMEARNEIAVNLVHSGADAEFAAEMCGLPLDKVRRLVK